MADSALGSHGPVRGQLGDREGARRHYRWFTHAWREADHAIPELAEATAYLQRDR